MPPDDLSGAERHPMHIILVKCFAGIVHDFPRPETAEFCRREGMGTAPAESPFVDRLLYFLPSITKIFSFFFTIKEKDPIYDPTKLWRFSIPVGSCAGLHRVVCLFARSFWPIRGPNLVRQPGIGPILDHLRVAQ